MQIGVLAVQGDYEAHVQVLHKLGVQAVLVTHPSQLHSLQGLILPGGESTTMLKFLTQENFLEEIRSFGTKRPVFGTCAGAILLAKEVLSPHQISLDLIDVTIERNAFGRQLASHVGEGLFEGRLIPMPFIRAPKIDRVGLQVTIFATYQEMPVGVRTGRIMMTTFHPELTADDSIHRYFLELAC